MNQRPQGVATVWYFVAVSFDAASGRVVLHQDPINEFPFDESRGTTERPTTIKSVAGHDAPLLMLRCGSRPGGRPGSTTASSIIHGCIAALEVRAAGSELDRADFALGTPPHTLVLASSSGHSDAYQHVVEQINTSNNAKPGGTQNPLVRADMVFLEYPNGGAVFSSSAIAWCGSLSYNNYTNNVLRITENVLRRFAADTPLPAPGGRQGGQEINK
jgi:hypothetical protein